MPYSTTLSVKKIDHPTKKPKVIKYGGGGVEGRYDHSQRFNDFFKGFPDVKMHLFQTL